MMTRAILVGAPDLVGRTRRGRQRRRAASSALALGLVLAACGGGSGSAPSEGGASATTQSEGTGVDEREPVVGGRAVIAVEFETDGFDPTTNRFAVSGLSYANTVFDPLMAQNAAGEFVPYLAETMEPNADYTLWTMTLRAGVLFHDGTPLTSAAVVRTMEGHRDSPLTGPALRNLVSVTAVDDLTVEFQMARPWVAWPSYLTGQVGFVPAPSMLDDENGSQNPIGTGPFVFVEWIPGSRMRFERNEDYWRSDEGLPYLDEIEFRPIVDPQTRVNALLSGEVDIIHTADSGAIEALRDAGDQLQLLELRDGPTEENMILLNTAQPPFDQLVCRQAVARAIDRERLIEVVERNVVGLADGPFSGQADYEQPEPVVFDLPQAQEDAAACADQQGTDRLSFAYATTDSPVDLQSAQLLQDMWSDAGIEVEIGPSEGSQFLLDTVLGNFQAAAWRQHGASEPDQEFVWWDIENAGDVGSLGLNLGRYRNPELQQILLEARETPDPGQRHELYNQVSEIFAADLPFIYLSGTIWAYAADPDLGGLGSYTLPGGGTGGRDYLPGVIRAGGLFRTEE